MSASAQRGGLRPWLLGLCGVGLLLAAFPPLSLWPLALLVPWPLTLLAIEAPGGGAAFRRLWLAGLPFFALGTFWLTETSWVNLVPVTLVSACWTGFYGWMAWRVLREGALMPALPVLWTAHELLRLKFPLSGYPWLLLGHALAANPVAVQAADVGGVLLLSFVAACGAAAALSWQQRRPGWRAALVVIALAAGYGVVRPHTLEALRDGPRLVAIQPAFSQQLKDSGSTAKQRYDRCLEMSLQALRSGERTDLLIWPETMWPFPIGEGPDSDRWDGDFGPADARRLEQVKLAPLLAGGPLGERATQLLLGTVYRWNEGGRTLMANSVVQLDAQGRRLGRYDKHILVPGGETVPLKNWMPAGMARAVEDWIADFAGFVVDLRPGPGPSLLRLDTGPAGDVPFGVTICFENAYGDYCREFVRQGAAFLVNVSNEAWFGTSTEFDQMELHSILRAVETRRALFRSTNSGISCLVRPDGRRPQGPDRLTLGGSDRAVAGVFPARVPLGTAITLYVRWGDLWGWLCLAGAAALLIRSGRGSLRRSGLP